MRSRYSPKARSQESGCAFQASGMRPSAVQAVEEMAEEPVDDLIAVLLVAHEPRVVIDFFIVVVPEAADELEARVREAHAACLGGVFDEVQHERVDDLPVRLAELAADVLGRSSMRMSFARSASSTSRPR